MWQEGRKEYFETALSDFTFDVAAGGAIRHLVDRGYSVEQMMKELSYPVPRTRVEKAVYRYMTESGILLKKLPLEENIMRTHILQAGDGTGLAAKWMKCLEENSTDASYMECPFGIWKKQNPKQMEQVFSCLNSREREYLKGILWEPQKMYHRLTERMQEIAAKLVKHRVEDSGQGWKFYFLKSQDIIIIKQT